MIAQAQFTKVEFLLKDGKVIVHCGISDGIGSPTNDKVSMRKIFSHSLYHSQDFFS